MSKRFGRNQKRRLQQQLDEVAEKAALSATAHEMVSNSLRHARRTLGKVADVLGRHFVGLDPMPIDVQHLLDHYRICPPLPFNDLFPLTGPALTEFVDTSAQLLDVYRVEAKADLLTGAMHCRLESRNGDLAYGLSREGLRGISRDDLAREIGYQFACALKSKL